jgi:phage FluMu protein Com
MNIQSLERVELPDPRTTTIFEMSGVPGISGKGQHTYHCPSCKSILLENVIASQMARIVFKCPKCGGLSRMYSQKTSPQHTPVIMESH